MAIKLKTNVLERLKDSGYSTYKLRKDKVLGEAQIQKMRSGEVTLPSYIDTVCKLLNCQPGDIMEYIPDEE